ncbi:hypothetical protein DTO195F2_7784 [Paecilomyces variotii]|nr:hypothetical protein DTO195F2_7784 [Paecilomyces variotii]
MSQITASQAAALASFKASCAERGLLEHADDLKDGDLPDGITDDSTLLRFLEGNQMDASRALMQFEEATQFHKKNEAVKLYDLINVTDFEDTRKLYPHWTGRRDNRGLPIMMIEMSSLNQDSVTHWRQTKDMPNCSTDTASKTILSPNMAQRACVNHDYLTRFIFPLCSAMRDRPNPSERIRKSIYIVDASSLCLKQAWDLREFAQDISWILSTCYPETIERIFVCSAPLYFSKIWGVLKRFVNPATAEKIVVLRTAEVYPTLSKYTDHKHIPVQFGGEFVFTNGMLPDLDDKIRQESQWVGPFNGDLPPGPIKWVRESPGHMKAAATGTADGMDSKDNNKFEKENTTALVWPLFRRSHEQALLV